MRLENKTILVTGACGQLGQRFCISLANEGAIICVADLDKEKCKDVLQKLHNKKLHTPVSIDVSEPDSVKEVFDQLMKKNIIPDVIINNAGIAVFTPYEDRDFDDFMNVIRVNTGGTFLCIKEGSKIMRENNISGSIINIGSIYGVVSGDPRIYTDCDRKTTECYGASKAAVIHMTKYFAVHLSEYNIRVNCISPGGVYNNHAKDFTKNYSFRTPMGRMADESEIASSAIFLSSEESSYITGQNIIVDGGWTAW